MKLSSSERVTAQEYVDELMKATQEIYSSVQRAQERRAEETAERAGKGRVPQPLGVGQLVLLRRPPAIARDDDNQERSVSRKLQPKARVEVYRVIKRVGDSNYVHGDVATGIEATSFKQPVHADRIVPMDGGVLNEPIASEKNIVIEQHHGTIQEQAWDGRVRVQFATEAAEDEFAHRYRKDGATKDARKPGVWVDLGRHTYYFTELELVSDITEGCRKKRECGYAADRGADAPSGENSPSRLDADAERVSREAAQKTGKQYSSDYTGDGPSSSSTSCLHHGVELCDATSYRAWMDFDSRYLWYRGQPLYTCVLAFDKHNVVDTMNAEECSRFIGLRNQVHYRNNLGGALALISRGIGRWRESLEEGEQMASYKCADFLTYTEKIGRDPDRDGAIRVWRYPGMESHMICIDGDKGDAAQLLGLPLILFDDKEDNLTDIVDKGHSRNVGVVVRRGEAVNRKVYRRNRAMEINHPHSWVYWCWRFAGLFPQSLFLWAIFAVQLINPVNKQIFKDTELYDGFECCGRAYSSVWQTILTFTQHFIAGPIIEGEPWTMFILVPTMLTIQLGIMNLVLSVILHSAQQTRDDDVAYKMNEIAREFHEANGSLGQLCQAMDTDNSGAVTLSEPT